MTKPSKKRPVFFYLPQDNRGNKKYFGDKKEAYKWLNEHGGTVYGPYYRGK